MPAPSSFQDRRGTLTVTFTQTGTYSTWADLGGMKLVGVYSPAWPAAAVGSITFRADLAAGGSNTGGTGFPVVNEANVAYKVNPFGSGALYAFTPGTILGQQFLALQVGTGGTANVAGGGTIILLCEALA